ncbi:MAG: hypothetical protein ABS81_26615 [Pseudonocardia sp. SCN 72-86]|nr:MAG: hypothetical protein ABS81_26615 [Pseudonocardia sp. SCN 72-86]
MAELQATALTTHELLLALAGRVDDDLLATCRELVAVGEDAIAFELLTAALVAGAAQLPPRVRETLVAAAARVRIDLDADRLLPPAAPENGTPHRFRADTDAPGLSARIAEALAAHRPSGGHSWLTWRTTPAGSAPGPVPHPVLLVEIPGTPGPEDHAADVLAYRLSATLQRVGLAVGVEVFVAGSALPAYHGEALSTARPVPSPAPAAPVDPPGPPATGLLAVVPSVSRLGRPLRQVRPGADVAPEPVRPAAPSLPAAVDPTGIGRSDAPPTAPFGTSRPSETNGVHRPAGPPPAPAPAPRRRHAEERSADEAPTAAVERTPVGDSGGHAAVPPAPPAPARPDAPRPDVDGPGTGGRPVNGIANGAPGWSPTDEVTGSFPPAAPRADDPRPADPRPADPRPANDLADDRPDDDRPDNGRSEDAGHRRSDPFAGPAPRAEHAPAAHAEAPQRDASQSAEPVTAAFTPPPGLGGPDTSVRRPYPGGRATPPTGHRASEVSEPDLGRRPALPRTPPAGAPGPVAPQGPNDIPPEHRGFAPDAPPAGSRPVAPLSRSGPDGFAPPDDELAPRSHPRAAENDDPWAPDDRDDHRPDDRAPDRATGRPTDPAGHRGADVAPGDEDHPGDGRVERVLRVVGRDDDDPGAPTPLSGVPAVGPSDDDPPLMAEMHDPLMGPLRTPLLDPLLEPTGSFRAVSAEEPGPVAPRAPEPADATATPPEGLPRRDGGEASLPRRSSHAARFLRPFGGDGDSAVSGDDLFAESVPRRVTSVRERPASELHVDPDDPLGVGDVVVDEPAHAAPEVTRPRPVEATGPAVVRPRPVPIPTIGTTEAAPEPDADEPAPDAQPAPRPAPRPTPRRVRAVPDTGAPEPTAAESQAVDAETAAPADQGDGSGEVVDPMSTLTATERDLLRLLHAELEARERPRSTHGNGDGPPDLAG